MTLTDLTGFTLAKAARILAESGRKLPICRIVRQPREKDGGYDESWRILAVECAEDGALTAVICKPIGRSAESSESHGS